MAEVIGLAILSAVGAEAAAATALVGTLTVAGAVGSGALLLGGVGLNLLANELRGDTRQKIQGQQFSTRQSMPARRRVYGTWKLGGPYVCYDTAGGRVFTAIYLCEGPINRFLQITADDVVTTLPAQEDVSGPAGALPYVGWVQYDARHGGVGPSQFADLLAPLSYWTPNHRLDSCAYIAMRATAPAEKHFRKVYPAGSFPATRATIEGSRVRSVLDPAQTADPATWKWTDHCSPCAFDLITHRQWGMGVPESLMDLPSWAEAAAVDGELVTEKDGLQWPRYFLGGMYELTEDPASVLRSILDARDGELYLTTEGKIGITGGRYVAPDVTIRQEHVLSIGSIERGSGKRATFNRLNISYVSRVHDFQQVEGDPWIDEDAIEQAGQTLEADFSRPWVPRHHQLRRLAKIHMAKKNPKWRIAGLVTNRGGFPALFEDAVLLSLPRYRIFDVPFRIERRVLSADQSTCTFDLVSINPSSYDFDSPTEQGIDPPLPGVSVVITPDPPADLTVTIERRAVSGGINATFLRLTATMPDGRVDLSLVGRYRAVGTDAFTDLVQDGDDSFSLLSQVLVDGADYEVQGAVATYGQALLSAYVPATPTPITAIADTTSTGAPTGFVANGGIGQASGAFTAPNAANFGFARLYRSATANFADAVVVRTFNGGASQSFEWTDARSAGVWRYWVRAFNRSGYGDAASTAGPITVTVT